MSQTITRGGPRSQIAIPAQGMIDFRNALTDLLEEFGTEDGGFRGELPEGRHMKVENKNFYFDVGQNNRGIYMRISEVSWANWYYKCKLYVGLRLHIFLNPTISHAILISGEDKLSYSHYHTREILGAISRYIWRVCRQNESSQWRIGGYSKLCEISSRFYSVHQVQTKPKLKTL